MFPSDLQDIVYDVLDLLGPVSFDMKTDLGTFWKSCGLTSNSSICFAVFSLTDLALPNLFTFGFCTLYTAGNSKDRQNCSRSR